jgi:tartrate-resistant acid phosphatase type 5
MKLIGILLFGFVIFIEAIEAQTLPSKPDFDAYAQMTCLPAPYRDAARRYLPIGKAKNIVQYLPKLSADDCFSTIIGMLPQTPDGRAFVFASLDRELSGKIRTLLFTLLSWQARSTAVGRAPDLQDSERRILETHAASDPDVNAALQALATLRSFHAAEEASLLARREAVASTDDLTKLEARRLQYYMWYGETNLPQFAFDPPSVFTVVSSGKTIRVLVFGDFGTGSSDQLKAASAMRSYGAQYPFDFGITLGDNFYRAPDGTRVNSPYDRRWRSEWENPYGGMGIKFFPVFGNNDYVDPDGPAAELAYTRYSTSWDFPAPYYTFTAGSAQFFAIDNIRLSSDELDWLDGALGRSTARWKVVYGHYPIHAAGGDGEHTDLISKLLPILEKRHVQIYLNGHVHSMQDIQTDSPVHFYTSGAGGAALAGDLDATYKKAVFKAATFGFTVLEIDSARADVIFVDSDGKEIYRSHATR